MTDFVVRPFAFMRLTHEALRSGFVALREGAEHGNIESAAVAWHGLAAVVDLHKRQEEEVFFPLLDKRFDGAVANAGLRDTHQREAAFEARVEAALDSGDAAALRDVLDEWAPSFEAHLKEEEDVMMPLTGKVAPTLEGRAAEVHNILAVDWTQLREVHLPYVVGSLAATKPYGPLRMFVAAVQAAAGDRYAELEPAIRAVLPEDKVGMLTQHGHLGVSR